MTSRGQFELIWNIGQYEHIKWTGSLSEWELLTEKDLVGMGQQWSAAKGCILHGRDNPEAVDTESAQELIERELGGKVIEVTENPPAKKTNAWDKPIETPTREWEKPGEIAVEKPKPVSSGFEDF